MRVRVCAPNARVTGKTYINQSREEECARESGLKKKKKQSTKEKGKKGKNRATGARAFRGAQNPKKKQQHQQLLQQICLQTRLPCHSVLAQLDRLHGAGPTRARVRQNTKMSQTSASLGAYEEERLKRQSGGIPGCRRQRKGSRIVAGKKKGKKNSGKVWFKEAVGRHTWMPPAEEGVSKPCADVIVSKEM